ncbi:MAG TPA: hypothetical protein VF167_15580 [Longimicrobiaceae bacterium]
MAIPLSGVLRPVVFSVVLVAGPALLEAQSTPTAPSAEADTAVALTAEERARYVGTYEVETSDGLMAIHVYEEGDGLMARPEHEEEPSPLIPLGEHRFRPVLADQAVITFAVENDRATSFTIVFPDERGTMVAQRRP